jgi:hypothetical protein
MLKSGSATMKRFDLLCGLFVCLSSVFCSCTKSVEIAGFDWPQWRGPEGNGQSRETDWDPASFAAPRVLWKADVGVGYSNVVCLDAATGKQIWRRPFAV